MPTTNALFALPHQHLILASASAARQAMFTNAGLKYTAMPACVDEEALRDAAAHDSLSPADTATMLAEAKARKISARHPDAVVVASDQLLVYDGAIYAKPTCRDEAVARIKMLAGGRHELVTAGVIMLDGQRLWHVVKTPRLTMRALDADFAENYVDALGDDTLGHDALGHVALQTPGVYMIEGLGAQLFSAMEGCFYSIMGFPLLECLAHLRTMGLRLERGARHEN